MKVAQAQTYDHSTMVALRSIYESVLQAGIGLGENSLTVAGAVLASHQLPS